MTSALLRKVRHVLEDPVLRRWLLRRVAGLENRRRVLWQDRHRILPRPQNLPKRRHPIGRAGKRRTGFTPEGTATIELPGASVNVPSDNPGSLFDRDYPDLETSLGAHRFAWVPLAGRNLDPDWVAAIWECWVKNYGATRTGWPWHAYTAGERAINIIDFADRFGLPGNREKTLQILAAHGETIRNNLEYFGEDYTSNHLSNNGRGLLKIGLALGLSDLAADGARIMVAEAERIFGRSGLLNEGSSHYHLLVTRNYIDAWFAADSAKMEQAALLRDIAERAVAAISGLCLPGGMPLIGDISPDAPPAYFATLTGTDNDGTAWPSMMGKDYRRAALDLISRVSPVSPDRLAEDGWHRFEAGDWRALTFVSPDGWPPMPGHGHQDLGSFELHDGPFEVIVDPGRGSYADSEYVGAALHNCITVAGHDPAPVNRPYYDDAFRRRILPDVPELERTRTGCILRSAGYARIAGIGNFEREWHFRDSVLNILDRIDGRGKRRIERRYFTSADVTVEHGAATLNSGDRKWKISADTAPIVTRLARWTAYGENRRGHMLTFGQTAALPFEARTVIERL